MKCFSIAAVLLFVASGLAPAAAAPIPSLRYEDLAERALSASAQTFVTWVGDTANSAAINAKTVCFYSGTTSANGKVLKIFQELRKFKRDQNCNQIHDFFTPAGVNSGSWTPDDWDATCEALAKALTQPAKVLLGKDISATSVWIRKEKPALLANAQVTRVEAWEVEASQQFKKIANVKG